MALDELERIELELLNREIGSREGGQDDSISVNSDSNRVIPSDNRQVESIEKVGVIGGGFDVPSATAREAIRSNPLLAPLGPLAGLAAISGIGGKNTQSKSINAAKKPSTSETFQDEAIRETQSAIAERASKRTGIFSPQTKLGKFLMGSEFIIEGTQASTGGFAKDFATNPLDILFSLGDIVSGSRALFKGVKTLKAGKSSISSFKQAVKPSSRSVRRAKDIVRSDKKIAQGLEAITDNKDNLIYVDDAGRLPENVNEAVNAASQTKEEIFRKYTELRNAAGESATVDMRNVATDVFESQSSEAARIANPSLRQKAFEEASRLADEGEVSLETAENIVKRWNKELEPLYSSGKGTGEEITLSQIKARAAASLRKEIDNVILKETGESYQLLKNTYGSLVDLEKNLVKKAEQLSKATRKPGVEVIDTVPIIYGAFTGNLPLLTAGVAQKGLKKFFTSAVSSDALIKKTFDLIEPKRIIRNRGAGTAITSIGKSERELSGRDN